MYGLVEVLTLFDKAKNSTAQSEYVLGEGGYLTPKFRIPT